MSQFNSADFIEVQPYERNGKTVSGYVRKISSGEPATQEETERFYAEKYGDTATASKRPAQEKPAMKISVPIPYELSTVREAVKKMGGKWDPKRKQWTVDEDRLEEIEKLTAEARKELIESRRKEKEKEKAEREDEVRRLQKKKNLFRKVNGEWLVAGTGLKVGESAQVSLRNGSTKTVWVERIVKTEDGVQFALTSNQKKSGDPFGCSDDVCNCHGTQLWEPCECPGAGTSRHAHKRQY